MKKPFWIHFLRDPATGVIHCTGSSNNSTADFNQNIYYIGTQKIIVDVEKFKK